MQLFLQESFNEISSKFQCSFILVVKDTARLTKLSNSIKMPSPWKRVWIEQILCSAQLTQNRKVDVVDVVSVPTLKKQRFFYYNRSSLFLLFRNHKTCIVAALAALLFCLYGLMNLDYFFPSLAILSVLIQKLPIPSEGRQF